MFKILSFFVFILCVMLNSQVEAASCSLVFDGQPWVAERNCCENGELSGRKLLQVAMATCFPLPPQEVPQVGTYFGCTFPRDSTFLSQFLSFVHRASTKSTICTLEIGCAMGDISSLVPLAFANDSHHFGIDLSAPALSIAKRVSKRRLSDLGLDHLLSYKEMSAFNIKEEFKEGELTAIYMQNVLHYFNPKQVVQFFQSVEFLLKKGGRIFIEAMSTDCKVSSDVYERNKEKALFAGWAEVHYVSYRMNGRRIDQTLSRELAAEDAVYEQRSVDSAETSQFREKLSRTNSFNQDIFEKMISEYFPFSLRMYASVLNGEKFQAILERI